MNQAGPVFLPQPRESELAPFPVWRCRACRLIGVLVVALAASNSHAQSPKPTFGASARPVLVSKAGGTLSAVGMAVDPKGKWFVTEAQSGAITIWSTGDGSEFRTFQPFQAYTLLPINRIAIASDGDTIAVAAGSELHLIDASKTQELRHFSLDAGNGGAWQIAAHPRQMVLAAIDQQGNANVVSLQDGNELFHVQLPAPNHGGVPLLQVRFSPSGDLLAITTDTTFELWDWAAHRRVLALDAHAAHTTDLSRPVTWQDGNATRQSTAEDQHYFWFTGTSFSPVGSHLALCSRDELAIVDVHSGVKSTPRKIHTGIFPGCIYLSADHVVLPEESLDAGVLTVSTGVMRTISNVNFQGFLPIPGSDKGVILANSIPSLMNARTGEAKTMLADARAPNSLAFTPDGKQLLWDTWFKPLTTWNLQSGEALKFPGTGRVSLSAVSGNGEYMAFADSLHGRIRVFTLSQNREESPFSLKFHSLVQSSLSFSKDGAVLACAQGTGEVNVFSVPDHRSIAALSVDHPTSIAVESDGKQFAVADRSGTTIYSVDAAPKKIQVIPTLKATGVDEHSAPNSLAFSPDGKWLAVTEVLGLRLFSTGKGTAAQEMTGGQPIGQSSNLCAVFSPDSGRIAFTSSPNGVELQEIPSGKTVFHDATNLTGCPIAFSANGRLLAVSNEHGIELLSADTGTLVASLNLYGDENHLDWLVVSPDGLFDGTPGAWTQLSWRFSGDTFDVDPVEIFFREYFRPGLLGDILAGRRVTPPADIAQLDRRQPEVTVHSAVDISNPVQSRQVHLELEVAESRKIADSGSRTGGSGARDLRLFRNGTLVKAWRGDLPLDRDGHASLNLDVSIISGENRFVAYAFNRDNVKSPDGTLTITGAESLQRRGTAYVVTIGIDQYAAHAANRLKNLEYAEADASDFGTVLVEQQKMLAQFGPVKLIALFGTNATRTSIVQVLHSLAGEVQPEDGVLIFYAGHGIASGDHFFLLPQDFNPSVALDDPQANTLSEVDLSHLLDPISPARSFLVIDACNSGEALGGSSLVVGPMNSTGLAQLAYEKGLYILAASQGNESAMESPQLAGGHGYLTYALVEEGLKTLSAAEDGAVLLRPWFEFASRRVPGLQSSAESPISPPYGTSATIKEGTRGFKLYHTPEPEEEGLQHPRVFYRREPETDPFVVARPPASAASPRD